MRHRVSILRRAMPYVLLISFAFCAAASAVAQVVAAPTEAKIEAGEIRLEGAVVTFEATQKKLVLNVSSFTLPSGRSTKLAAAKAKTIWIDDKTVVQNGALTALKTGAIISVVGKDGGSGADLQARLVVLPPIAAPAVTAPVPLEKTAAQKELQQNFDDLSESKIGGWEGFAAPDDPGFHSIAPLDAMGKPDFTLAWPPRAQCETSRRLFGENSIKFLTGAGYDTGVRFPTQFNANWNLSGKKYLTFWTYAENKNVFQGAQPVVILKGAGGLFRYTPRTIEVRNHQWRQHWIPLEGSDQWTRTVEGTPSMDNILSLEIHQDTFDSGFIMYYDGIRFVESMPRAKAMPRGADPFVIEPKVFLIVIDPILKGGNGERVRDVYGWSNPFDLVPQIIADLKKSSHGTVNYKIAVTQIVNDFPYEADGGKYTDRDYHKAYARRKKQFHDVDLQRFITDYKIVPHIENGDIDEVWLYTPPFGVPESIMAGKGAQGYWVNSLPLDIDTKRSFVVMGLNFERGVAEAIHSFGHRTESIMKEMYGKGEPMGGTKPYSGVAWDKFTRIDKEAAGEGGVGSVHFPPNGTSDYDYHNPQSVFSSADDWLNYPNLKGTRRAFSFEEWGGAESRNVEHFDGQREYLNWWYSHIPHFSGRAPDGRLNNWWRYITDVDAFRWENTTAHSNTTLPAVAINNLMQNQEVSGVVNVRADAASDALLGRVDFFVDDKPVASDGIAPYTFDWDTRALAGEHIVSAKAFGLTTIYEALAPSISVTVK